jgi:hypothetical protein
VAYFKILSLLFFLEGLRKNHKNFTQDFQSIFQNLTFVDCGPLGHEPTRSHGVTTQKNILGIVTVILKSRLTFKSGLKAYTFIGCIFKVCHYFKRTRSGRISSVFALEREVSYPDLGRKKEIAILIPQRLFYDL